MLVLIVTPCAKSPRYSRVLPKRKMAAIARVIASHRLTPFRSPALKLRVARWIVALLSNRQILNASVCVTLRLVAALGPSAGRDLKNTYVISSVRKNHASEKRNKPTPTLVLSGIAVAPPASLIIISSV